MKLVVLLVAAALAVLALPVSADHPQDPQGNGTTVAFDHVKGNEWWVEVKVSGDQPFDAVGARDDGGEWVGLSKQDWGVWAGSFHIEPGHRVQFKAVDTVHAGEATTSCWFTHPEGVEQCGTGDDPAPSEATFDHAGGNEWWVQVDVIGSPDRVQAMDTGGTWTDLQHKDWGDWAESLHIEPGHDVRFRAMTDDAWQESCWFTHPDGVSPDGDGKCKGPEGGDGGGSDDAGAGFDAAFSTDGGNEWWVEVDVDANERLTGVEARDDGGDWIALEKKDWGAWAKSFRVEDGSIVDFRATSQDGDVDISGEYRWPSGEQVSFEPDDGSGGTEPSIADVAFGPKAGNEWWVETLVVFNGTVTGVEARAERGDWHALTLRDWGAWAGSFHVPMGSTVEFRATTDGGADVSDGFLWPEADGVGGDGSWPQEGSYLQYETWDRQPGGYSDEGTLTMVRHDGTWWSLHQWTETRHGEVTGNERRFSDSRCPSYGPTQGVAVGDVVVFTNCDGAAGNATVRETRSDDLRLEGEATTIDVWYATDRALCDCLERQWAWDDDFGLVTYANLAGRGEIGSELADTDAPLR